MFKQLEKTATGNGVNSSRGLIQEFDQRVCQKRDGAAQLSLVAATEISSELVPELSQVKCLLNELPLEFYICVTQSLDAPNHV